MHKDSRLSNNYKLRAFHHDVVSNHYEQNQRTSRSPRCQGVRLVSDNICMLKAVLQGYLEIYLIQAYT
jgi:hypothetical protein